jgi:hypothetical protein
MEKRGDAEIVLAEARRHDLLASLCGNEKLRQDHVRVAEALRSAVKVKA